MKFDTFQLFKLSVIRSILHLYTIILNLQYCMSEKLFNVLNVPAKIECNNCGFIDSGIYCSSCGLSLLKQRISVSNLVQSIIDYFSNFEDKYFTTVKMLTINPFVFIKSYIEGKRDDYYIPFKYFFLNLSLCIFVFNYFDLGNIDFAVAELNIKTTMKFKSDVMFDYIMDNYGQFYSLVIIPFYVFIAKLLFRKSNYNVAEISTAITYLLGQFMLLQFVLNVISGIFHSFYFFEKYLVIAAELLMVMSMSFRFFISKPFPAIWKSMVIIVFIFYSMKGILYLTQNILDFIYLNQTLL